MGLVILIGMLVGIILAVLLEYRERLVDNVQMYAWNYARPVYYSLPSRWDMVFQLDKWTLKQWGLR